ncbi:hypothetical protein FBU30_003424 [Linnemannia zychae]|nr:hypothetical protein FBU30_003424 [Linnemannia zychae]
MTAKHLNESVLKPAGKFKSNSKIAFKTTFQLYQDPLLDYTLAIIAKNWNELPGALSTTLSSQLAFPERKGAMQWIWLWERMDRQDWLFQWKQLEFKQWLIDHFHQSNHSDWTAELFRLSNKALGTPKLWVQDLLDTIPNLDNPKNILPAILRQASIDISGFPSKKRYYQSDSWTHFDQIESWLSGILAVDILVPQKNCVVEQKLWREIAMIGILARDLRVEDVMQSVHLDVAAAIREDPSSVYLSHSTSGRYHDVLTSYLEETSATTLGMSYEGNQIHSGVNPTKESTKALAILQRAIQETVSSTHVQDTLDVYRNLLLSVAQNAAFRSRHLGLISQVTELKFRSLKGDSLWEQIKLASTLPHPSKKQKHDSSLKRDSSSSPLSSIADISDFADNYLRSDLAKMCAASTILTVDPNSRKWTGQFSNWFISLAESSVYTECLAKNLQYQGRLVPGSRAYDKAMWILLQNQEYDVAAALHCHAFLRKDTNNIRQPSTEEVRGLIHALVTSDDQKYLEKAQWIVEQHLNKSKPGSIDTVKYVSPIDISIMTNLAGAWSRRAEFDNVRNVIEIMKRHDIPPNMVFYNTILKSLVDLTPLSRPGKRTIGSGNQPRTRELGREIMVRQLLKWKRHCHEPQDSIKLQSDLEKGWHVFLDVASIDSSGKKTLVSEELGSPLMLKNLITMSRSSSRRRKGSYFWPDGHTFSILLGAFAKRGEIEPISELFVEMKRIGLEPDVVICNILANAFAKKGDLKSVNQVLHEARNRNMEPGLFLTNAVLDSLVESGASVVKIREILGAMINNDASPITSKLEANTHGSRIDFSRRQRHSVANGNQNHPDTTKLLPTRTSEGAQFESGLNNVAFTTLIKYHIRQNDLRSAQHVVQAMKEAEMALDNRAYVLLLSGSIKNRDIYAGLNTLRMMRAHSNIYPDAKAWKGLLRCALELQNPMQPTGRYQASDDGIVHSLSPNRPRDDPVFLVLKELSTVLDDIEQSGNDPIFRSTGIAESNRSKQQYLSNILTSSWIALPDKRKYSRWELEILNPEVKGKRSLLKRLLDHFLRPAISESSGSLISSSSAPLSPRMESKEDILERCRHAMWLIRLVESSGIELGPEWKEDVVVRSVQKLTGQSEEAIEKEMSVEGAVRSESSQSKPRIKSRTRTRAKVRARARARRSRNQP